MVWFTSCYSKFSKYRSSTMSEMMTVIAFIRDKSFEINVADGSQTVEWLADVVLFKYKRKQFEKLNCRGVKYHNGMLNMYGTIASQIEDGHEVYILLEGDEEVDAMFGDEV